MTEKPTSTSKKIPTEWLSHLGLEHLPFKLIPHNDCVVSSIEGATGALFRYLPFDETTMLQLPSSEPQQLHAVVEKLATMTLQDQSSPTSSFEALRKTDAIVGEIIPVGLPEDRITSVSLKIEVNTPMFARPHVAMIITDKSELVHALKTTKPFYRDFRHTRQSIPFELPDEHQHESIRSIIVLESDNDARVGSPFPVHPMNDPKLTFSRFFYYEIRPSIPDSKMDVQSHILTTLHKEGSLTKVAFMKASLKSQFGQWTR